MNQLMLEVFVEQPLASPGSAKKSVNTVPCVVCLANAEPVVSRVTHLACLTMALLTSPRLLTSSRLLAVATGVGWSPRLLIICPVFHEMARSHEVADLLSLY